MKENKGTISNHRSDNQKSLSEKTKSEEIEIEKHFPFVVKAEFTQQRIKEILEFKTVQIFLEYSLLFYEIKSEMLNEK
jgi:hypothetical protein